MANPNESQFSTADSNNSGHTALVMEDAYMSQRQTSIESIEKTLFDITGLFKRFANIVQEHQVMVERIDTNTETALYDIEGAKKELREVYEDTTSTRKLMLKIFFILIIFATFYILFVL